MPDNQNSSEWVMVPRTMTDAMREAAGSADDVDDCYHAMLAAAPPAPAMLNGVEGLVAEWEALIAHPDTSTIMRNTLEHVVRQVRQVRQVRAADNRDAAGAAVELTVCCGRQECGGECGNEWRGTQWVRKATPTAAPAGEAVALSFDAWWKSKKIDSEFPDMMDDRSFAEAAWNAALNHTHPPAAEVRKALEAAPKPAARDGGGA